jgi:hypothetical protein
MSHPITYKSPEEFLKYLQTILTLEYNIDIDKITDEKFTQWIGDLTDEEFKRLNREQYSAEALRKRYTPVEIGKNKTLKALIRYSSEGIFDSNILIERLLDYLFDSLNNEYIARIKENIAFGVVSNSEFNAKCVKSEDSKYAILLYDGLMLLLLKCVKCDIAFYHPEKVLSCSRGNPKTLNPNDYFKFSNEIIENYKNFGVAFGAKIKFDFDFQQIQEDHLALQELFIICHELGHFFNNDFDNDNNFYNLTQHNWKVFDDNKNHLIEFKADITGFSIFEKIALNKFNYLSRNDLIIPLASLFDILASITERESESHPKPVYRILNILEHHYGKDLAIKYKETYEDPEKDWENFSLFLSEYE